MLEYMEKLFKECEILLFDVQHNRIMCFPHIINITVQHILKRMSLVEAPETDDDSEDLIDESNTEDGCGIGQTFDDACAQDPIARLRKIVMEIQSSRQRRDAFMTWIETGNKSGLFVVNNRPVEIPPRQLFSTSHCPTDSCRNDRIPLEWTGIYRNETGIHRNGTGIHWNECIPAGINNTTK